MYKVSIKSIYFLKSLNTKLTVLNSLLIIHNSKK